MSNISDILSFSDMSGKSAQISPSLTYQHLTVGRLKSSNKSPVQKVTGYTVVTVHTVVAEALDPEAGGEI